MGSETGQDLTEYVRSPSSPLVENPMFEILEVLRECEEGEWTRLGNLGRAEEGESPCNSSKTVTASNCGSLIPGFEITAEYHGGVQLALIFLSTLAIAEPFSTSLGDQYPYIVSAIATDAAGNTYVVGSRQISVPILAGGIVAAAAPRQIAATGATYDVFLSKLDPNGNLVFTDTFAGKGIDQGTAVAVDPSGNIYIAGTTTSSDFPLSNALQTQSNALGTGFVLKLSNDGAAILYSTYFGGTLGTSAVTALATDFQGNLYLTGTTTSTDFPHTSGLPFGPNPLATSNTASSSPTFPRVVIRSSTPVH